MNEIDLIKNPSGRCFCSYCQKLIKENQVEVIQGQYKGHFNYAKYHYDCIVKYLIKLLDLDIKKFKKLKEELTKEEVIEELK